MTNLLIVFLLGGYPAAYSAPAISYSNVYNAPLSRFASAPLVGAPLAYSAASPLAAPLAYSSPYGYSGVQVAPLGYAAGLQAAPLAYSAGLHASPLAYSAGIHHHAAPVAYSAYNSPYLRSNLVRPNFVYWIWFALWMKPKLLRSPFPGKFLFSIDSINFQMSFRNLT